MSALVLVLASLLSRSAPAALVQDGEATALLSLRTKCAGKLLADATVAGSWDRTKQCSDWNGVFCDGSGHVVEIMLDGAEGWETKACSTTTWSSLDLSALQYVSAVAIHRLLEGPIPAPLKQLVGLGSLDLSQNHLNGKLSPTVPLLRNLRSLKLASNKLTGNIPINMPALSSLDLHSNQLAGPFDSKLLATPELRMIIHFDVGDNKLTGKIADMAPLSGLRYFDMSSNALTGRLPDALVTPSATKGLRVIHLESNAFEGPIPLSFSKLPELREVSLQNNKLTGLIPSFVSPMCVINVANNDFSCPRPKGDAYKSADDCTCRAGHFSATNMPDDCRECPSQTFVAKDSKKTGGKSFVKSCTPCTSPLVAPKVGSSACSDPDTGKPEPETTTLTPAAAARRFRQEMAIGAILLAVLILIFIVICFSCVGCFQRYKDDTTVHLKREHEMQLEVDAEVRMHHITAIQGNQLMSDWRHSYYSKSKTNADRTCSWMCFVMHKKHATKMMIQKAKNGGSRVTPQSHMAPQSQTASNEYSGEYEVQYNSPDPQVSGVSYSETANYEYEESDSEAPQYHIPEQKLSKKEWKIKRAKSKLKFEFGDWQKLWDDEYNCDYYYNTVTEESTWDKPEGYVDDVELDH